MRHQSEEEVTEADRFVTAAHSDVNVQSIDGHMACEPLIAVDQFMVVCTRTCPVFPPQVPTLGENTRSRATRPGPAGPGRASSSCCLLARRHSPTATLVRTVHRRRAGYTTSEQLCLPSRGKRPRGASEDHRVEDDEELPHAGGHDDFEGLSSLSLLTSIPMKILGFMFSHFRVICTCDTWPHAHPCKFELRDGSCSCPGS